MVNPAEEAAIPGEASLWQVSGSRLSSVVLVRSDSHIIVQISNRPNFNSFLHRQPQLKQTAGNVVLCMDQDILEEAAEETRGVEGLVEILHTKTALYEDRRVSEQILPIMKALFEVAQANESARRYIKREIFGQYARVSGAFRHVSIFWRVCDSELMGISCIVCLLPSLQPLTPEQKSAR